MELNRQQAEHKTDIAKLDACMAKVQRDIALRDVRLEKRDIWLIATLVGFMAFGFTVLVFLIRMPAPA